MESGSQEEIKIVDLKEAVDVKEVGGKAAALGQLLKANLPVPRGFVIPVAAFKEHVNRAELWRADAIEAGIIETQLNVRLASQVRAAWDEYKLQTAAVRSSAIIEDSPSASFAGQFSTRLSVEDAEAALKAIKECWASLFSDWALKYARDIDIDIKTSGGMAVIVQEMIEPEYAGVAFTCEPVTGNKDVFYAEWVKGVGKSLVSGDVLDGRIWLNKEEGKILRADYLQDKDIPPDQRLWQELVKNLKQVVDLFRSEQDVEWAWTGKNFFFLQVRPDTSKSHADAPVSPWVLPGRPPGGWKEEQLRIFKLWDEYNPPVVYPLDFHQYMAAIWQASIDMLDSGNKVPQVEQVVVLHHEVPVMVDPAGRIAPSDQFPRGECAATFDMEKAEETVCNLEQQAGDLAKLSDDQLLQLLDKTASTYRDIQVTRLLKGTQQWIAGEQQAEESLQKMLSPLGVEVKNIIESLKAGVNCETSRMNRALCELAEFAVREGKNEQWCQKLDEFIQQFGHLESNGTLLCESRESIVAQIDRMIEQRNRGDGAIVLQDPSQRFQEALHNLSKRFQDKEQQAFKQAVSELRRWVELREDSKTRSALLLPLLKRLQKEAGERLVKRQLLQKAEDVRLLTPSELREAFKRNSVPQDIDLRRATIEWKKSQSWLPNGFLGKPCSKDDRILFGVPASPGTAEGPARIVHGPEQFGEVRNGEVVIARATNPMWTQLFNRIKAIVVENGSRLSHAAVVAREVGIPAVVGIPGVLAAVQDGEQLHVDGTRGFVERILVAQPAEYHDRHGTRTPRRGHRELR